MRLFLAGGAMDEVILGSSRPVAEEPDIDAPDCILKTD